MAAQKASGRRFPPAGVLPRKNGEKFGAIPNDVSKSELLTRHFHYFSKRLTISTLPIGAYPP